ncbi:MAG: hypothetical protein HQL30_04405 [Candidatus Omnitrophica bacterium]|nr:hypothetical protein [Candidatus Omnitrophota bacterium]
MLIKVFSYLIIFYGVYHLLGIGDFEHFSIMFKGLPKVVTLFLYFFSVLYGVCGLYSGAKILKKEDWARKFFLVLTVVSVVLGFGVGSTVIANFREFIFSKASGIPSAYAQDVFRMGLVFTSLATVFELAVVVFFTRPRIVALFRK